MLDVTINTTSVEGQIIAALKQSVDLRYDYTAELHALNPTRSSLTELQPPIMARLEKSWKDAGQTAGVTDDVSLRKRLEFWDQVVRIGAGEPPNSAGLKMRFLTFGDRSRSDPEPFHQEEPEPVQGSTLVGEEVQLTHWFAPDGTVIPSMVTVKEDVVPYEGEMDEDEDVGEDEEEHVPEPNAPKSKPKPKMNNLPGLVAFGSDPSEPRLLGALKSKPSRSRSLSPSFVDSRSRRRGGREGGRRLARRREALRTQR
ncbi:hypothetical protein DACRYDRAFT_111407 [Dacryopinax primogenitus]|uniref:Uncharacterized protein n=1 Tax=Dacryopinax primogenitus (strain DJM 731) TaxID=1858805 RepID=M5G295_DACPD|nr:uncharacterized protein DACRYDRAFT_111407 [Dacryopinax primogenitus]EJT97887.1 hypothetical protein DACRYDRAFT_111407 [Dacryopinax primogenitus]